MSLASAVRRFHIFYIIAINTCMTFSFRSRWLPGSSLLLFVYRWLPVDSFRCWHCGIDMKTSLRENCLGVSLALAILVGAYVASFCGGVLFCFCCVLRRWERGSGRCPGCHTHRLPAMSPFPMPTSTCLAGAPLPLSLWSIR